MNKDDVTNQVQAMRGIPHEIRDKVHGLHGMSAFDDDEMCSLSSYDGNDIDDFDDGDDDDFADDSSRSSNDNSPVPSQPHVVILDAEEPLSSSSNVFGHGIQKTQHSLEDAEDDNDDNNDYDDEDEDEDDVDDADSFTAKIQATIEASVPESRRCSLDFFAAARPYDATHGKSAREIDPLPLPDASSREQAVDPPTSAENGVLGIARMLGMNRRPSISRIQAITAAHKELFHRFVRPPPIFGEVAEQVRQSDPMTKRSKSFLMKRSAATKRDSIRHSFNLPPKRSSLFSPMNSSEFRSGGRNETSAALVTPPKKRLSDSQPSDCCSSKKRKESDDENSVHSYCSPTPMDCGEPTAVESPNTSMEETFSSSVKEDRRPRQKRRGAIVTSSLYAVSDDDGLRRKNTNSPKYPASRESDNDCASSKHDGPPARSVGPIKNPRPNDVLFGRGGHANHHEGNKRFRDDILLLRKQYRAARKGDKQKLAEEVVTRVYSRGGRMLKCQGGRWFEVEKKVARDKASQCLRETRYPPSPEDEEDAANDATTDADDASASKTEEESANAN